MIIIKLTKRAILQAAIQGAVRAVEEIGGEHWPPAKEGDPVWDNNINGAIGELAVAKWRGEYWSGIEGKKTKDVGLIEVRATTLRNGRLLIRERDEGNFILATISLPIVNLVGWYDAITAKTHKELEVNPGNRGCCWMIPQEVLYDMETL